MEENYGLVKYNTLHNIGEAIRYKTGTNNLFYPSEMANAINNISSGGGGGITEPFLPSMRSILSGDAYYYGNYGNIVLPNYYQYNFYSASDYLFMNKALNNSIFLCREIASAGMPCDVDIYYSSRNPQLLVENGIYIGISEQINADNSMLSPINIYRNTTELYTPNLGDVVCSYGQYYFQWRNGLYNSSEYNNVNGWFNLGLTMAQTSGPPFSENNNVYYNAYGAYYCFVYNNRFNNNEFSIMDMTSLFNGNNFHGTNFICGNYTKSLKQTYNYYRGMPLSPVCGPNVTDMSFAYSNSTVMGRAACGPNVTNMFSAYYNCQIYLTSANIGNNVKNLANAYGYCTNLKGDVVIPSSVTDISYSFSGCNNLNSITGDTSNVIKAIYGFGWIDYNNVFIDWNNFNWSNLKFAEQLFQFRADKNSITSINGFPNLTGAQYLFHDWALLMDVDIQSNNLSNICGMCANDQLLSQASYDNIINSLNGNANCNTNAAFANCIQIKNIYLRDCYTKGDCSNIYFNVSFENVTWEEGLTTLGNVLSNSSITNPICPDTVINARNAYNNCHNIIDAVCSNNVNTMANMYYNCSNLINAACSDSVIYMSYTYYNCTNLVDAVCGDNVTDMYSTYAYCANLVNGACGNNVINMNSAYTNCFNLINAWVGPNVVNLQFGFSNCFNLISDIELRSNHLNCIGYAFYDCVNVQNILVAANSFDYPYSGYLNNTFAIENTFFVTYGNPNTVYHRNIVCLNQNTFNYVLNKSCHMCGYLTNSLNSNKQVLTVPINVNVNGNNYEAVRVASANSQIQWTVNGHTENYYLVYNVYCAE